MRICDAKFGNFWRREGDSVISSPYNGSPEYADPLSHERLRPNPHIRRSCDDRNNGSTLPMTEQSPDTQRMRIAAVKLDGHARYSVFHC